MKFSRAVVAVIASAAPQNVKTAEATSSAWPILWALPWLFPWADPCGQRPGFRSHWSQPTYQPADMRPSKTSYISS